MTAHAWVNDVDFELLGVRIQSVTNARSLVAREWPLRPLPGRGQVRLTDTPTPGARRLLLKGSQAAENLAALEDLRQQLVWYIKRRDTVVRLADKSGAFLRCEVVGADIPPIGPWARDQQPAHEVEIELIAEDPAWYATAETVVNFSGGPTQCPIGNTASWPRIVVTGPIENPVVTQRAADGSLRRTMALNVELAAGESITVDCEAGTVVDHAGASRMSVPGDGLWVISLDPADAGGPHGPWPTLSIAPVPSGGASAVAYYRIANE